MKHNTLTQQFPLYVITIVLFFVCGFISILNSMLSPALKSHFHLDYTHAMLVQFSFFLSFALMSLPIAWIINQIHYKRSILLALNIIILGCLIFIPATIYNFYSIFLWGLFILASGVVMLEVSVNPLVTLLGSLHTSSARLNLAQSANPFAATISPLLIGNLIIHHDFISLYITIAVVIFLLVLIVYYSKIQIVESMSPAHASSRDTTTQPTKYHLTLVLGVSAMFVYVGAEISAGSLLINYLYLPQITHMSYQQASHYLSIYWGGILIGRLIGGYLFIRLSPAKCLRNAAIANSILIIGVTFAHGYIAMWCLLALGTFNSIMFPTIISLTVNQLPDKHSRNKASGYLMMGIAGGAVIPEIQGYLADHIGLQYSFILLILPYIIIIFFSQHIVRHKVFASLLEKTT